MMRGARLLASAILLAPAIVFGQAAGAPGLAVPAPQETPANPALQARQNQLQTAIVKRDAPALRALIRSGMALDFNFNDLLPRGRTFESPLTLATYRGHLDMARLLLEGGADAKRKDADGQAPIHRARSATLNPAILAKLKAKGLDLDAAAADGHTALISLIVEQPMAIRAVGSSTMASVAQSAVTGEAVARTTQAPVPSNVIPAPDNVARAKALLELGADPNRKFQDMTPLMLSIGLPGKPKEMAEMLFSFGARVEFEETISKSQPDKPLIGGLGRSQLILNDQGILTGMKMGPLTWTALHNRPDIALRLLERERKVTRADRDFIHFAALAGHWDLVIGALDFTREVDAANRADVTALMMAAHAGNAAAVRALLVAGARVNARSARDWPPFYEVNPLAALSGHPSRPPLVGGYTALRAARERGNVEAMRILVDAGGKE